MKDCDSKEAAGMLQLRVRAETDIEDSYHRGLRPGSSKHKKSCTTSLWLVRGVAHSIHVCRSRAMNSIAGISVADSRFDLSFDLSILPFAKQISGLNTFVSILSVLIASVKVSE